MSNDKNKEKRLIGERLKALRVSKGLTLEQFGNYFNPPASKGIVSRWESGKSIPSNERIKMISEIFDISTMYILFGKKDFSDLQEEEQERLLAELSEDNENIIKYINNYIQGTSGDDVDPVTINLLARTIRFSLIQKYNEKTSKKIEILSSLISNFNNFDSGIVEIHPEDYKKIQTDLFEKLF